MKVGFTKINETMAFGVPEPERLSIFFNRRSSLRE